MGGRSLSSLVLLVGVGCGGDSAEDPFGLTGLGTQSAGDEESDVSSAGDSAASASATTTSGDGDGTASGDGDGTATGDGDGTTTTGDGDGTTTTGDGDGTTTTGDGDGTTTAGDGDGTTGDGDGTGGCGLGLTWTFETSADGFTSGMAGGSGGTTWQRGQPLNGPQGTNQVWATNLSGNHNVGECSAVVSPSFSLQGCSSASASVRHWFLFDENSCWPDCGGGVVQVSTNGGLGWTSLTSPGYTTGSLEWLGSACTPPSGEKGWNGSSGGWRTDTVDLSAWVGNDTVQLRFLLGSKGSPWFANQGWYIDEVSVD